MLPSAENKNMLDLLNSTVDFGCTHMFCCGYGCCALPTGSSMTVRAGVLDVWVARKHLPRMSTRGSCADDVHHQPSDTLTQPRRNIQKYVCLCCAQLLPRSHQTPTLGKKKWWGLHVRAHWLRWFAPQKISHKSSDDSLSSAFQQVIKVDVALKFLYFVMSDSLYWVSHE